MKLPESKKDFDKLMKNVDFTRILQITVPILQPVIIGGLWLLFAKLDKKADAVSKFIAIAESIPTIDLNLPKPVVLASLYHSIDEALDMLNEVIQTLRDIEIPSAEKIIDEAKEQILDPFTEPFKEALESKPEFQTALANCIANARESLGDGWRFTAFGAAWIVSCMLQKGFTVSYDYVKGKI
tara:strand:- start:35 stop:583 length:549 start_codon:yes stop_codon:yes gene_type:complete